jgi:hypothetical protein
MGDLGNQIDFNFNEKTITEIFEYSELFLKEHKLNKTELTSKLVPLIRLPGDTITLYLSELENRGFCYDTKEGYKTI